jgi:hypothetical protein
MEAIACSQAWERKSHPTADDTGAGECQSDRLGGRCTLPTQGKKSVLD